MPYVLRQPGWSAANVGRLLWPVALGASFLVALRAQGVPLAGLGVAAAVMGPLLVLKRARRPVVVGVGAEGVTLLGLRGARGMGARQRRIPWPSIWRVVLVEGGGQALVGVRLRPGAPLPPGVRLVIDDPSGGGPLQPDLCQAVDAARLDQAALAAAVAALAPPGVELVGEPLAASGWPA